MPSETRLSIAGMSCAGCVSAVEKALLEVPGVTNAMVNLGERTATVNGDYDADSLLTAIRSAGYDAAELRDLDDEQALEDTALQEYRRLWWRAISAGVVGMLLFSTGMSGLLPGVEEQQWLWLGISLVTLLVLIFVGGHFFSGALKSLRAGRGNMDTLVAMGTGAAWLYSTIVVIYPELVPGLARHVYFEAAVIIVALVSLGSALELRARGKTSEAIKHLIGLQPATAHVIRTGEEIELPVAEVGLDETIRIRAGERIPVDGTVFEGESHIDESMLTGEPMPVKKSPGGAIYGGTLNTTGSFLMRSTHIGRDTALAHIIEQVRQAQSSKPAIGRLVDKVAAVFVPVVIGIAIISFILWLTLGPEPRINYAVASAITVLVIACPCALGLATPISIMVGVGRAAEHGILIRNGEALQQAGMLTTIVLDKTGTITTGKPTVTNIQPTADLSERQVLQIACDLEAGSGHPLATAIHGAAGEQDLQTMTVENFQEIAGHGVTARQHSRQLRLGNTAYMRTSGINIDELTDRAAELENQGKTVVYLAADRQLLGILAIADPLKPDSAASIKRLHELGLKVVMLTGDNRRTADAIANQLGAVQVIAEVLPGDKAEQVRRLQANGEVVAMVGDGINDAPALAQANVGIAIGTGTDVAIESADITLMAGSLGGVTDAITLSRATMRNIKQNLFGAFIYNVLGIPVAAGVLYPATGMLLSPVIAAAAMSMSSVTVVSNALRLRKVGLD
ncbi:MAG: heavy metal translocating P-type ATPase [Gammaproteobacteria bacterium]|nr:heavy metal translocating P-type ATPase [Gammaproteobacteria bacterium]